MISVFTSRHRKKIALLLLLVMYSEFVLSGYAAVLQVGSYRIAAEEKQPVWQTYRDTAYYNTPVVADSVAGNEPEAALYDDGSGPTQPEMQSFQSVGTSNMVDLFSGDFSYNIPLMDVGGYPVNISYRSGIGMEQEASWVGLGWNVNPGTITRNMRGLPDEFTGKQDTITKTVSIKDNKTIGVTGGADFELTGLPIMNLGGSLGVFYNTYKGWGMETGLNASINAGNSAKGAFTGGLSLTNNSQEGFGVTPSFTAKLSRTEGEYVNTGSLSMGLPYNSRSGLKGLSLSAGISQQPKDNANQYSASSGLGSMISFATPSYTPAMSYPMTSSQYTFTAKIGGAATVAHPSFFISGYVSNQKIDDDDKRSTIPAFGYLNYQQAAGNPAVLLDFNREKDIPYREKPAVPNIAVPSYTYDIFSITGEGTGGMFRAYRGDIGYVHDNALTSKDGSGRFSVDFGTGFLVHAGADLNINRAYTQTGPWLTQNAMRKTVAFKPSQGLFQGAYFKNPSEKTVGAKAFYDGIGGEDVVAVDLSQNGSGDPSIVATSYLNRYRSGALVQKLLLTPQTAVKQNRDKRAQVISYLTAEEASAAANSRYIENYALNTFSFNPCDYGIKDMDYSEGVGLLGAYYNGRKFDSLLFTSNDTAIAFSNYKNGIGMGRLDTMPRGQGRKENFTVRWMGRVKAPETGTYIFRSINDDGVRLYINDSLIMNDWNDHAEKENNSVPVNLVAGQMYDIKLEFSQAGTRIIMALGWTYNGGAYSLIPKQYLYHTAENVRKVSNELTLEKRINVFRKSSHLSQINVLNPDGRRYVYGIPVYNLAQKDVTFSVDDAGGNINDGLVKYQQGVDNTRFNSQGKDGYFNSEEIPAYAHSFLLTGILSPDYADITGDGITDDDPGDAVKFNYSKVAGVDNPYQWRAPYVNDSASYNEGLRTYSRDDKGSYSYGKKELWYLNSIVSKTMVATFKVSDRNDLLAIDENGHKDAGHKFAKKLDEINLYTKADLVRSGVNAVPVKTVHFEYSYELCQGINKLSDTAYNNVGKLTLKKIWFTYNGNNKGELNPYVFHYNTHNPRYNQKAFDRWGNYKNALQNPGSVAGNLLNNAEYPYALQDSTQAAYNAAAWALDSIQLPSGGRLKVTYESDDYAFVQNKRAMQMCRVTGLSYNQPESLAAAYSGLYVNSGDNLYIIAEVPDAVTNSKDVFSKYLEGNEKFYFRMNVRMPTDQWGKGFEYVPCYAGWDKAGGYGMLDAHHIWFKMKSIDKSGFEGAGNISPLAKAAIQFLRLNLPSKAYPDSEVMGDFGVVEAVKNLFGIIGGIVDAVTGFDNKARGNGWARSIDPLRSFVRLNNPSYKKYGGGIRVKRVVVYDNWNKMSKGKKESTYGQEYEYTTTHQIDGKQVVISSGVAAYEPFIGADENPFRLPLEYAERVAPLAPVTLGYTEEPLGEGFFPSAAVGYSKVRVKSIHTKNIKSLPGYDETEFYTAYDFPTFTERTVLNDNKKRYSPKLANFLKINAANYLGVSQGFKVELNDMHGKTKSQSSYSANNDLISQTLNYYKTEKASDGTTRLSNTMWAVTPSGEIDTAALIGRDVELMMDMRQEKSESNGLNFNVNVDMFVAGLWPILIPTFLGMFQHEETVFKSVATTKIVQRYGILDSIVQIQKGSRATAKNLLYDSETGEVILSSTPNEFNDPVYTFNYPSHWTYDGMGAAYRNIDAVLDNIYIKSGKITRGLPVTGSDSVYFASGDEILMASRQKTDPANVTGCIDSVATFADYSVVWAVNANEMNGGAKEFYFIDRDGRKVTANNATLKVIRSGRRNLGGSVGQITSLGNPLVKVTAGANTRYQLVFNAGTRIINASATEFQQNWKVEDKIKSKIECAVQ